MRGLGGVQLSDLENQLVDKQAECERYPEGSGRQSDQWRPFVFCHDRRHFHDQRHRRHFTDGYRTMPSSGVVDAYSDSRRKERVSPRKRHGQATRSTRPSPAKLALELAGKIKAISTDQSGVAAIEFGLFAIFLSLALVNVVDVTMYLYQRMQAENATEVAAQAVWKTCDLTVLPLTTDCSTLAASVTAGQNALGSTSLGTPVALVSGSPTVGYYCVNSSNALQYVSNISSKPADCTAAGTPSLQPRYYIQVQTTYTYTPIFPGMSISSTFPTPINRTSLMRLV